MTLTKEQDTDRQEHLAWCKKRALVYCEMGDRNQAFASMGSDLNKNTLTANHAGMTLGLMMIAGGQIRTCEQMKTYIEGFN